MSHCSVRKKVSQQDTGIGQPKKVLLMGASSSGKTSMRSIIFANFVARDTTKIQSTVSVEKSSVRFMGNLHLSLWDCGAQFKFLKSYFTTQREQIFTNVSVLIFVVDVKSTKFDGDMEDFSKCIENLKELSKDAKIFVLVHKMDLVPRDEREKIYQGVSDYVRRVALPFRTACFQTSIWEETLYKAWSQIVNSMVPNSDLIHSHMTEFMNTIGAEEVILFERATFLDIAHTARDGPDTLKKDVHRFERLSNIIKMFKLSCLKSGKQLQNMQVHNSDFDAFLDEFTKNTYIMVIVADKQVHKAATSLNIRNARSHFEKLLQGI